MTPWAVFLLFQLAQMRDLPAVSQNPHTGEADLLQGRKLYGGRCAGCHGPAGNGGKGANLAVPVLPRGQTDIALYTTIRYGLPETEMPGVNMTQREIWQIAAFVRTLGALPKEEIAGDRNRGRQLVHGKAGCLQCHFVVAEGNGMAPPLTDIGRRRSPGFLRSKLLDSATSVADDFRTVQAATRDGRRLSGIRLNEDSWSIQFRDTAGVLHSVWKKDLAELQLARKTPMPSYRGVLGARDIDDMVAYLSELRGVD